MEEFFFVCVWGEKGERATTSFGGCGGRTVMVMSVAKRYTTRTSMLDDRVQQQHPIHSLQLAVKELGCISSANGAGTIRLQKEKERNTSILY